MVTAAQLLSTIAVDGSKGSSDINDVPSFDFSTVFKDTPFFNSHLQDFTFIPAQQPSQPGPEKHNFRWYDPPKK